MCREWSEEYETGSESEREEADEAMPQSIEPDQTAVPDLDDAQDPQAVLGFELLLETGEA